jgi:hypothetical protein
MPKVTVYQFEIWDRFTRSFIRSNTLATRRAIDAADGVILIETAQQVDSEMVSQDGVVVRWPMKGADSQ